MEIKGFSNNLNIQASQNAKSTSETANFEDALNSAVKSGDDEALKKSCKDFESILLGMMYKSMRATVGKSELLPEDQGTEIFQSMLDDEYVKTSSEAGGMGLADILYKQLKKQLPQD